MPNLQGASSVGLDEGGYLYVARMVGRSRPGQAMSWPGGKSLALCWSGSDSKLETGRSGRGQ